MLWEAQWRPCICRYVSPTYTYNTPISVPAAPPPNPRCYGAERDGRPDLSQVGSGNTQVESQKPARPGPGRALRPRMTYHHTIQVTGKRLGTIEERRARFYFRQNTSKIFLSVETFF